MGLEQQGRQMPLNGVALAQGLKDVHALHHLIARLTAPAALKARTTKINVRIRNTTNSTLAMPPLLLPPR
jgi:hypothetical protein